MKELPQWKRLRDHFGPEQLDIVAVPVDEDDTESGLRDYLAEHSPAYRMLPKPDRESMARVTEMIVTALGRDGLPASFVADASGRVLEVRWRAPTVSAIRSHLNGSGAAD